MYEESVPVRESPMRRAFAQDFTSAYQMLPNLLMFAFFFNFERGTIFRWFA